ncbi:MAG: hybrid sensor histidine kinase/response regulator [Beggiatoa sp. IS2]|nr:MAG: hybrid sensor histidine kinase/response regulator [Beggiatoa sp. IS2]
MKKDTVLIVDDVPNNVRLLLTFLSRAGFEVLIAQDGKDGIETAEYAHPDLILLDVMMPGMDGFEVCRQLKSQQQTKDIPVIFMTALTETIDKMKGFQVGAEDYITKPFHHEEVLARLRTHLKLRKQAVELQKRNQELEAFTRTVAHDLKNPLTEMSCYADIILERYRDGNVLDAYSIEQLNKISRASQKMGRIISALLLLARTSTAQEVNRRTLNMANIVDQVITQRLSIMIEQYQGQIKLPTQWPTALGYAPWIEEVWVNYISNGLKYGGHPPQLELGAEAVLGREAVRFWIRDKGSGLTSEAQQKLFTPFMRLHRATEGQGLGLSIVQQILEKLEGQVGVESIPGEGSLFYFVLPNAPAG